MTKLRAYIADRPKGEVARLAKAAKVSHAQLSRIADGHRGASLPVAIAIANATNGLITPADVAAAKKVNTRKSVGKQTRKAVVKSRGSARC